MSSPTSRTEQVAARAAVYARVSTREQAERTSLDTQQRQCRAHAVAHGWSIADSDVYVDDGISGAAASRPALDRLLATVGRGDIDVVIVHKLDRLGRSMAQLTALLADWDQRGVRLVSVAETFDSATPTGRLMRNMLGSFAEFEREHIGSRVAAARAELVERGAWPGGPPPFGYRLVRPDDARHTTVEIEPVEADTIREIVRLFVHERCSLWHAARQLNADGRRPRGRAGQAGPRLWTHGSLYTFLANSSHLAGQWRPRRRGASAQPSAVVKIPPILTDPDLHAIRSRLAEGARPAPRSQHRPSHLLSQRLQSPHQRPMYGISQHDRPTIYACADAPGLRDGPHCSCHRINAELIETIVWNELRSALTDPDRLAALADTALHTLTTATPDTPSADTLDRRVRELERALGDSLANLLADGFDTNAIQHATTALRQRLDHAQAQHQQALRWEAARQRAVDHHEHIRAIAAHAAGQLDDPDDETRRRLIDLLDIRVAVNDWAVCSNCHGKGRTPEAPDGQGVPGQRIKVRSCPTCRGHRYLPLVAVAGILPAPAAEHQLGGVPFRLVGQTA